MRTEWLEAVGRRSVRPAPGVKMFARAVLSDDHNHERGVNGCDIATAVLVEAGATGLADVVVELSLKLAFALERIAADQGVAAVDLADVWFVD